MFTADLLERMVKTFIQTFIATFGLAFVAPASVTNAGAWKAAAIAAVLASVSAAVSAATSVLSKPVGDKSTASIVAPLQKVPSGVSVVEYAPTLAEPLADEDHAA